jgi:hypothetical protein
MKAKALKRRKKMEQHFEDHSHPRDVTFFIGPVGAPPKIKTAYENALAMSIKGDEEPLDDFLDIMISSLNSFSEDTPQKSSPLKQVLEVLIDHEIGEFSSFVAKGFMRNTWTPIITIHLDRLTAPDGSPLGFLVQKNHGEYIAAMLGKTFKAEWIYTSWVFPGTPIDVETTHLFQTTGGGGGRS